MHPSLCKQVVCIYKLLNDLVTDHFKKSNKYFNHAKEPN
jgi:hypothetical protein